jgi:hypothetical protein
METERLGLNSTLKTKNVSKTAVYPRKGYINLGFKYKVKREREREREREQVDIWSLPSR